MSRLELLASYREIVRIYLSSSTMIDVLWWGAYKVALLQSN